MAQLRVVAQVADLSRVGMSLASIRNLAAATGAEVEAVFHQDAVKAVRGQPA